MRKLMSILLALVMILSLSTVAFAAETHTDMTTVTLTKEYKLQNAGTVSPAEKFTFSALTCTGVENAGVGVTAANAPVPTIGTVSFTVGEAGSATATKNITINLPTYTAVGVYSYEFTENNNNVAGVSYRSEKICLVVTVMQDGDNKVRVAAVHAETAGDKTSSFDNTYSAGSLNVKKVVTGIMGDREKKFTVKVTFTAPEGKVVNSTIEYNDGVNEKMLAPGWSDSVTATFEIKHDQTVTFTNIPYGVTYAVTEEVPDDYTVEYAGQNGAVAAASADCTITNNKDGQVDTGIVLDSMPYVLLLAVACMGLAVLMTKKRASREN